MDSTGGEAIHWRVFVTTVYDATGKQGGGAIHWRVFVTAVYDATGKHGAGLFIGVSLLLQYTTRQASRGRGY